MVVSRLTLSVITVDLLCTSAALAKLDEPITIDLETSGESFQILGRVVWSLRKY
jgi:hypothetical protein